MRTTPRDRADSFRATRARDRPATKPDRRTRRSESSTRRPSSEQSEAIALVLEQPSLDRDRITVGVVHESAQRASAADDTMAGNDQRNRIGAARLPDGARRAAHL